MRERVDLGKAMREALPVYEAPASLQAWAREEARKLDQESPPQGEQVARPLRSRVWRLSQWRIAAGLVIAAAAGWGAGVLRPVGSTTSPTSRTTSELVDAHVRSLLPGHLLDVESTDRHTVKPWFAGKTDIAPVVVDLSDKGFPLLGGRLDYLGNRPVAALIYQRQQHVINLLLWPAPHDAEGGEHTVVRHGYTLLHWTTSGMTYWAISNLNMPELRLFAHLVQQHAALTPSP